MLLVNDDKPQVFKGSEKGGTRTDDDVNIPCPGPFILVVPFTGRHTGIHHRNPVAKAAVKPHDGLPGKGNLRNQHNHLTSRRQHIGNQLHVNFRLTASRHPVKQIGPPDSLAVLPYDSICNLPLERIQLRRSAPQT